jgi:phosphoglycerate-specific signal transduction histidine kinase
MYATHAEKEIDRLAKANTQLTTTPVTLDHHGDWNFNRDAQITALMNNKQNHRVEEGGLRNRSLQRKITPGQSAEGAAIHGKLI